MFKSCLDLVTFPRPRELVLLESNSACCLFGRRPLFRGQVWMVSQKPQKGSGIVLPITAISTHGPNLPSEVARSTSNSSHKHLRTTQTKWTYIEWRALLCPPDFVPPGFVDVLPITHTHTPTHHTCVHSISLHHLCVHSISLHLVSSMCFHTHSTKWKYLECTHRVCPLDVSTHVRVDRFPHTHTTHTNEPRKPGKHKTSGSHMVSSGCCRTHSTHTNAPQKPRGTSSNQPQLCVHSNSFLLVLLVRSKNTHTHTAPHTPHVCKPRRGQKYSDSGQAPFWTLPGTASFRAALF